ncbi:cohesin domain-containing protein [Patescibacteria group bacterium]|nr:cohesin domain-containing protein [Patescibacteria group bacterium]
MGVKIFKFIINLVLFVVGSWVVVHISALFGVFIAFAYPIWQFILPGQLPCLFCTIKEDGEYCTVCKRVVNRAEGIDPDTLKSIILNSLLILVFSLFSIGLVLAEQKILSYLGYPPTPKTVTFIIPNKNQYPLGKIFPMKIEIAGIKTPINAVQADVGFNPEILEVVNVSTVGSFANIFIQKEIDNDNGYIRLTGGLPNPGYFSERGDFGTVYFKGITPGVSEVRFLETSMVLANDGRGTNVVKEFAFASYLILPDEITEDEKQQQEVLLGAQVLGEQTDATKMVFYEESDVLGVQEEFDNSVPEESKETCPQLILCFIEFINNLIINFWKSILGILFNPEA